VSAIVKERENRTIQENDLTETLDSQDSLEDEESGRLNAKASDNKGDYKAVNSSANYTLE
jgi:hypothetical protein